MLKPVSFYLLHLSSSQPLKFHVVQLFASADTMALAEEEDIFQGFIVDDDDLEDAGQAAAREKPPTNAKPSLSTCSEPCSMNDGGAHQQ